MQGFGILRTKWGVREIFKEYQHTGCPYTHIYKIHSVSGCWSRDNMVFRQLLVVSLYTGKKSCFVGSEFLATWYKLTQTGGLVSYQQMSICYLLWKYKFKKCNTSFHFTWVWLTRRKHGHSGAEIFCTEKPKRCSLSALFEHCLRLRFEISYKRKQIRVK